MTKEIELTEIMQSASTLSEILVNIKKYKKKEVKVFNVFGFRSIHVDILITWINEMTNEISDPEEMYAAIIYRLNNE